MAEYLGYHHLWRGQTNECSAGYSIQPSRREGRVSDEMGLHRAEAADEHKDRDRPGKIHLQGGVGLA